MPRTKTTPSDETPAFNFSLTGQTFTNVDRFLQFWREYPDRDGLKAYLYRVALPCIDSRQTGRVESSLDTWETDRPVPSADDVLRAWGSGKFQFMLNDQKKPAGFQQLAKSTFVLEDSDVPAVYNPSDLIVSGEQGAKNRPFIERWLAAGWQVAEGQSNEAYRNRRTKEKEPFACLLPPSEGGGGKAAGGVDAAAVDAIFQRANESNGSRDQVLNAVLGMLASERNNRPADSLSQALDIMERIKPQSDPVQVELLKVVAGMVQHQQPAAAVKPVDHLESTRATLGFLHELRESGFIDGGARETGGSFWPGLFSALPAILGFFERGITAAVMARAAAGGPAGGGPAPAGVAGSGAVRRAAAPAPAPAAEGEETEFDESAEPEAGADQEVGEMFGLPKGVTVGALTGIGKDAASCFRRGIDGYSFAHSVVCKENGEVLFAALHSMGKTGIMQALQMLAPMTAPDLAEKMKAEPAAVAAFVDSFLEYGKPAGAQPPAAA